MAKQSSTAAEAAVTALRQVGEQMHERFGAAPGPDHGGRLAQLDSALATAQMAVVHLFDEDERARHLHDRLVKEPALHTIHGHQDTWREEA